jgi:hypothetical protein
LSAFTTSFLAEGGGGGKHGGGGHGGGKHGGGGHGGDHRGGRGGDHRGGRDHDYRSGRDHHGYWSGHGHWGISAAQCRDGGGYVSDGVCHNGRYSGDSIN